MRRVSVKLGIKERMNEILGTDTSADEYGVPGLTLWSIQAAMIENTRRIVRGIVGDSTQEGRVLSGLIISKSGDNQITIPPGVAFTPGGDIIVLGTTIQRQITGPVSNSRHIYINHIMDEIPGETNPAGKRITFYNKPGTAEIVYDDKAAVYGSSVPSNVQSELISDYGVPSGSVSSVYLGRVDLDSNGKILNSDYVTPTVLRGFGPFGGDSMMRTYGIYSVTESTFDRKTNFNGLVKVNAEAEFGDGAILLFSKNSVLKAINSSDEEKTGQTVEIQYVKVGDTPGTLTFVKGILVAFT